MPPERLWPHLPALPLDCRRLSSLAATARQPQTSLEKFLLLLLFLLGLGRSPIGNGPLGPQFASEGRAPFRFLHESTV